MPKLPHFKTESELADFVDTHDTAPYWDDMTPVEAQVFRVKRRKHNGSEGEEEKMTQLGTTKWLNPRDVWKHEALEFTPWLEEEINRLAEAIGLEIGLVERESEVGDFSADLVGRDMNSQRLVIIENQLDPTDPKHLGNILTYAAGKEAHIIVWVSPKFRDEHRAAIDWLNAHTDEDIWFFGVELELLQVDDSRPAPIFRLVAKPNEWQKENKGRTRSTELGQKYHDFFTELLERLKKRDPKVTSARRVYEYNSFWFGAGKNGFNYIFIFAQDKRFRVSLSIDVGDRARNEQAFEALQAEAGSIEKIVGEPLEWDRSESRRACYVSVPKQATIHDAPTALDSLKDWAVETVLKFRKAFGNRIKALKI